MNFRFYNDVNSTTNKKFVFIIMRKSVYIIFGIVLWIGACICLSSASGDGGEMSDDHIAKQRYDSVFEEAVALIKKYETLHQPRHYPLVGYGHLVLRGEKFNRSRALSESAADALLRKDLLKNCAVFRDYGADSLLLGVLAYNIGSGNVKKSTLAKRLAAGERDLRDLYLSYSKINGKAHAGLKRRRAEEYDLLIGIDSIVNAHRASVHDATTDHAAVDIIEKTTTTTI